MTASSSWIICESNEFVVALVLIPDSSLYLGHSYRTTPERINACSIRSATRVDVCISLRCIAMLLKPTWASRRGRHVQFEVRTEWLNDCQRYAFQGYRAERWRRVTNEVTLLAGRKSDVDWEHNEWFASSWYSCLILWVSVVVDIQAFTDHGRSLYLL